MPILVDFVFQFLKLRTYKSSITLLLLLICLGKSCLHPFAKLHYFPDNLLCLNDFLHFEHENRLWNDACWGFFDEKVHHIPQYQARNRIKSYKNSL